jgi:GDPmannose 4,6-dehydratase
LRRALITGAGGQDGYYLTRLLLEKGYVVYGVARRPIDDQPHDERFQFVEADVRNESVIAQLVREERIDEIYNLAGASFGPSSWDTPIEIGEVLGLAVARILEVIRAAERPVHLFQASSSELFGDAPEAPQTERTPFMPKTPYGAAKLYAFKLVEMYRRRFGIFACNGLLFNHESPLRRPEFVTRKVTSTVARIRTGLASTLRLGNLEVHRDWGFAGDFVEAMWRMLQEQAPEDFVIATGVRHTVRELCEVAFAHVGLDYRDYVVEDPELFRSDEFDRVGDPSKARQQLGWHPSVTFHEMIKAMVDADIRLLRESPE